MEVTSENYHQVLNHLNYVKCYVKFKLCQTAEIDTIPVVCNSAHVYQN